MTNVLTPESSREVRGLYRTRFVFIGALALIVCGLVLFLALLPSYVILNAGRSSDDASSASLLPQETTDKGDIARAKIIMREFAPIASSSAPLRGVLEEVLAVRPKGVQILTIGMKRGAPGVIALSGTTSSRDDISAYRAALEKNPRFTGVSVPIGVLAGTSDDRFTMTITGAF